jgi:hypothetical protein
MSLVTDWLFGADDYFDLTVRRHLPLLPSLAIDAAPILKLNAAIIQQAVSDKAERIDFFAEIPDLEYFTCETLEHHLKRIEEENPFTVGKHANTRKQFAQMMKEAGIRQAPVETSQSDRMSVTFSFQGMLFVSITLSKNLVGPCVRAYPFHFNYQRCASVEVPENLVYVASQGNAAFASIDHYDRKGPHYIGICLDYEDEHDPRK